MWDGIFKPAFIEGGVTAAVWGSAFIIAFVLRRVFKSVFVNRPQRQGDHFEIRLSEILVALFIMAFIFVILFLIYVKDTGSNGDRLGILFFVLAGFFSLYAIHYCLNYRIAWNKKEIFIKTIFGVRKRIEWDAISNSNLNDIGNFYVQQGRIKISVSVYNPGHKHLWRYARCRLKNVPHVRSL